LTPTLAEQLPKQTHHHLEVQSSPLLVKTSIKALAIPEAACLLKKFDMMESLTGRRKELVN